MGEETAGATAQGTGLQQLVHSAQATGIATGEPRPRVRTAAPRPTHRTLAGDVHSETQAFNSTTRGRRGPAAHLVPLVCIRAMGQQHSAQ